MPSRSTNINQAAPRKHRQPRISFRLSCESAGNTFWLDVPLEKLEKAETARQGRDSGIVHRAPHSSTAASQPEVQALRRLIEHQTELVKDFEEVTGRPISDELLWRWARAKGGAEQACGPFLHHAEWRVQAGKISEINIAGEIEAQKVFLQGCDLQGRPVVLVLAARHVIEGRNLEETRKLICYTLETAVASADVKRNPVGQILCIFDLSGLRFANLDSKALQAVFEILQQHFPECLSELWFLNAPFIFWGLWKIVSPFIHPATKEKIVFVHKRLQAETMNASISEEILPAVYGGSNMMISIESAAKEMSAKMAHPSLLNKSAAQSRSDGRFGPFRRTGQFLRTHNPVWAAKVFGRIVKNSMSGIPRPAWLRRSPSASTGALNFSSRVSSAWKNRPPMPRPSYRLHHEQGKTIQLAYLDVAVFYLLFVLVIAAVYPCVDLIHSAMRQPSEWRVPVMMRQTW